MPKILRFITIFIMAFLPVTLFAMAMPGSSTAIHIEIAPFEITNTDQVPEIYFILASSFVMFLMGIGLLLKSNLVRFVLAFLPLFDFAGNYIAGFITAPYDLLHASISVLLASTLSLFYFYKHPPAINYFSVPNKLNQSGTSQSDAPV